MKLSRASRAATPSGSMTACWAGVGSCGTTVRIACHATTRISAAPRMPSLHGSWGSRGALTCGAAR